MVDTVIGHRGAAGLAPENTLESFQMALDLGCRMIECDVMLSADGEAFIFHDETLERTTNGRGEIGLVSAAYLHSLDAGSWFSDQFRGATIPTLKDTLMWLEKNNMQANIEIKPYPGCTKQTVTAVLTHIEHYWPKNKALPLVSSFDYEALVLCHDRRPDMPLGLLLHSWQEDWLLLAQGIQCVSIHLNRRIVTEVRIHDMKQQGYRVYVYTVNRRSLAEKLYTMGVDAVFSDYPDLSAIPALKTNKS